jgi:hypothetical protein
MAVWHSAKIAIYRVKQSETFSQKLKELASPKWARSMLLNSNGIIIVGTYEVRH